MSNFDVPLYSPNPVPDTGQPELERYIQEELWRIEQGILQAGEPADVGVTAAKSVSGLSSVNKFGRNPDVDTGSTPEDIWDINGLQSPPTAARTHNIASTNAADTAAGTGARTIRVIGLNDDWDQVQEDITLNGTTVVNTTNQYRRIYRMYVLTAGSGDVNAGNITAVAQVDSTNTARILAGNGQTLMALYTVPRGRTAFMTGVGSSINRQGGTAGAMADLSLIARYGIDGSEQVERVQHSWGDAVDGTSQYRNRFFPYKRFPEKTDIIIRCTSVTDNNTDVSAWFDLILEQ